jgi:hypothetical protein
LDGPGRGDRWDRFHNPLGLGSLTRRLDILRRQFLNHRFERRSPLRPLDDRLMDAIYSDEIVFPPRRLLMQPGVQTIDGLFFLISLGRALAATHIFEIGTYVGLTAWTFARNLPDATVHTLDIPPDAHPSLPLESDDLHRGRPEAMVYDELPSFGRIEQVWGDSATFDFQPHAGAMDLVYIDGAHSEPYVRSDTENARKLLSPAGAIVWDDYWRLSPGVTSVLHGTTDLDLKRVPGTRLVVYLTPPALEAITRAP